MIWLHGFFTFWRSIWVILVYTIITIIYFSHKGTDDKVTIYIHWGNWLKVDILKFNKSSFMLNMANILTWVWNDCWLTTQLHSTQPSLKFDQKPINKVCKVNCKILSQIKSVCSMFNSQNFWNWNVFNLYLHCTQHQQSFTLQ